MAERHNKGMRGNAGIITNINSDPAIKKTIPVNDGIVADPDISTGDKTTHMNRGFFAYADFKNFAKVEMPDNVHREMGKKVIVKIKCESYENFDNYLQCAIPPGKGFLG